MPEISPSFVRKVWPRIAVFLTRIWLASNSHHAKAVPARGMALNAGVRDVTTRKKKKMRTAKKEKENRGSIKFGVEGKKRKREFKRERQKGK